MTKVISRQLLFCLACSFGCLGQASSTADWFTDLKGQNTGHTVANFLILPISAGNLAIGELATVGMMDASDIPSGPRTPGYLISRNLREATANGSLIPGPNSPARASPSSMSVRSEGISGFLLPAHFPTPAT